MPDSLVFHMPMELGLPLMTAICPYPMDAKRKLFHHIVNKVDRAVLIVLLIDFQRTDPSGIIDSSVLIATKLLTILIYQGQELDLDLDLVPGNLLGVVMSVKSPAADVSWKGANAISF